MNYFHPNGTVLQRHQPDPDERDGVIGLLSLLSRVGPGDGLHITMAGGHSARIGPNTLRAILALLSIQVRPATATLYVLDETDHYELGDVRELTGLSTKQINGRTTKGLISRGSAAKMGQQGSSPRYPAKAIIELIAAQNGVDLEESPPAAEPKM